MKDFLPLPKELLAQVDKLDKIGLAWLSGYCYAKININKGLNINETNQINIDDIAKSRKITVLSGSQTGNARTVAEKLKLALDNENIQSDLISLGDYKYKKVDLEDIILLITSTQGEGEPPDEALSFHKYLFGKKAPKLDNLSYAILGLGDVSYPNFCGAAKDFDEIFTKLGANKLFERIDCDLDYEEKSNKWILDIVAIIKEKIALNKNINPTSLSASSSFDTNTNKVKYNKENPFNAILSTRQKITSDNANKDIEHIELDISNVEGLQYNPGDALGVWFENDEKLVDDILSLYQLSGSEIVEHNNEKKSIRDLLTKHDEITQNNIVFLKNFAKLVGDKELDDLILNSKKAIEYVENTPVLGVLRKYPIKLDPVQLHNLFRPITPRLYSISSSQLEFEDEIHLTINVIKYEYEKKIFMGGASSYLGLNLEEGSNLRVFIEENNNFRLPSDDVPIIMIGAGTGIAPFRAFMQERRAKDASGKNWLFFGNQKFIDDFLYHSEWVDFKKDKVLTNVNTAWSREGDNKVYVQHKLKENQNDLWAWLKDGAYIYVCGDASRMAKDVNQTLIEIIMNQGKMDFEEADEYLDTLRENKRYQRDVY